MEDEDVNGPVRSITQSLEWDLASSSRSLLHNSIYENGGLK